jgi:hypothetical protein
MATPHFHVFLRMSGDPAAGDHLPMAKKTKFPAMRDPQRPILNCPAEDRAKIVELQKRQIAIEQMYMLEISRIHLEQKPN